MVWCPLLTAGVSGCLVSVANPVPPPFQICTHNDSKRLKEIRILMRCTVGLYMVVVHFEVKFTVSTYAFLGPR